MGLVLLLLLVIAAIAAYLWYRQKMAAPAEAPSPSNRFHAVTIRSRTDACPEVRALASTRFIAKEAPRLPLDNCSAPNCLCKYEHYDDRRGSENRREAPETTRHEASQRRSRKDRRKSQSELPHPE